MYKNQISFKLMKKFSGSSAGEKEDLSKKEDFENNKSSKGNLKKMDNSKFSYEYPIDSTITNLMTFHLFNNYTE